ncbi:uncharacterized protein BDZ99DRAFT_527207 [Mytilinidion resinicola]|uniref:Uncharacterized protein n=1 Tax=Mytilinidion resinicola TaxID=574789 RepID=A0A6A6Y4Q7_9PEZI|nr:uncharacterized protein BDZ99DRAFT_527207 [Mytilinidion resinicola]KAF2802777.1 hypothetical protein BDZ99DRAFT_527207 [Mytilinidion resinicola]
MANNQAEQSSKGNGNDGRSSGAESMSFSDTLDSFPMPPNHRSRRFGKSKAIVVGEDVEDAENLRKEEATGENKEEENEEKKAEVEEMEKDEEIEKKNMEDGYESDDEKDGVKEPAVEGDP